MSIDDAIATKLSSTSGNTYPLVAKRICPNYIPDRTLMPAIMYERKPDSKQSPYNIDGEIDHIEATYKFHCLAAQEETTMAQNIADAVIKDLEGYHDVLDGVTINYVWLTSKYSDYDGINKRQRITVELEFWYKDK